MQIFKHFYDSCQQTAQDLVTTYVDSQGTPNNVHPEACHKQQPTLVAQATPEVDALLISDIRG